MKPIAKEIDVASMELNPRHDRAFEIENPALIALIALLVLAIVFIAGMVVGARAAQSQTLDTVVAAPKLSITVHDAAGRVLSSTCTRIEPLTFGYPGDTVVNCISDQLFCSAFGAQP